MSQDLLIACAVGDLRWARLCAENADPLHTNGEGWSALHLCAINVRMDCMRFLVEELKVDVNLASETGWTPLHLASRAKPENRALDCVHYLLQQGAEPNAVSDMGISSAHQAVAADNIHCLSTLVRNGANIDSPDKRGLLPVDVAKVWGHSDCTKYLQNIMWFQAKKKEELDRRKWVKEHQKSLEMEIKKYTDGRNDPNIEKEYQQWASKKGVPVTKVPTNCLSRAKPKPCFKENEIPDQWVAKIHRQTVTPQPKAIPLIKRDQLERVKKIQSLQNLQAISTSPVALKGDKCQQIQLHQRKNSAKKSTSDSLTSRKTEPTKKTSVKPKRRVKHKEEEGFKMVSKSEGYSTSDSLSLKRKDMLLNVLNEAMEKKKVAETLRQLESSSQKMSTPEGSTEFDIESYFEKTKSDSGPVTSVAVTSSSGSTPHSDNFTKSHETVKCSEKMRQEQPPPEMGVAPPTTPELPQPSTQNQLILEELSKDISEADMTKRTVRFADRVKYEYDAFERSPRQSMNLPIVRFDSSLQLRSCLKTNNNISFY